MVKNGQKMIKRSKKNCQTWKNGKNLSKLLNFVDAGQNDQTYRTIKIIKFNNIQLNTGKNC